MQNEEEWATRLNSIITYIARLRCVYLHSSCIDGSQRNQAQKEYSVAWVHAAFEYRKKTTYESISNELLTQLTEKLFRHTQ